MVPFFDDIVCECCSYNILTGMLPPVLVKTLDPNEFIIMQNI